MVLKLLTLASFKKDSKCDRLLSHSTSSHGPSAPELPAEDQPQLVTADNVRKFEQERTLVSTTSKYRSDLRNVADPALHCRGIIVAVEEVVDRKGNLASRVDVLYDNGQLLQGYRVGFAGSSKGEPAFDLETSSQSKVVAERLASAWSAMLTAKGQAEPAGIETCGSGSDGQARTEDEEEMRMAKREERPRFLTICAARVRNVVKAQKT
jgi:hypothetical protein